MVSINLLPQARQDKQKDVKTKSLAVTLLLIINGGVIGLIIVLFLVTQAQKLTINSVQNGITSTQGQVTSFSGAADIVTTQRNLAALPSLYSQRRFASSFFSVLENVTPSSVSLSSVSLGQDNSLIIAGNARNYAAVQLFVKAMQSSSGQTGSNFSDVSLKGTSGQTGSVTFNVTATVSSTLLRGGR